MIKFILILVFSTGAFAGVQTTTMPNPMTTGADIIYADTGGVPKKLPNGTAGQVLQSNGTTVAPSWSSAHLKISASYYVSANFAATSTVPVNYDTQIWDTNSAVTTSATAWKFTVPTGYAGKYQITILTTGIGAVGGTVALRKNGTVTQRINYVGDWSVVVITGTTFIQLADTDYVDITPLANLTFYGGVLSSGPCAITILRIGD